MRTLRAILNFAIAQYDDEAGTPIILDNPVNRLSRTRSWHRPTRRQTMIKIDQLPAWLDAVARLRTDAGTRQAETLADYLTVLLFTSLRRSEGARIRWQDVDLVAMTLIIPQTKNGEPLTLPLSDHLGELFARRRELALGDYVFPGAGHPGPLVEPRPGVQWVIRESGVDFALHDLRRTFITIAESLEISARSRRSRPRRRPGNR